MKANPFNELEKSEKIRKPESMRSYMTIEEVQALIDTPMPHEEYEIVNAHICSPASADYASAI